MADNIATKDRDDANLDIAAKDIGGVQYPRNILTDASGNDITPLTDTALRAEAVPVSGVFYQATQPVSFTWAGLTNTELRASAVAISAASLPLPSDAATQTTLAAVLGALGSPLQAGGTIGNTTFGAAQSGAWTVTADAGSGTFAISASALPLPAGASTEATVAGLLTNTQLRAAAVPVSGTVAVTGTFWQDTQPVSAASLPLPSGAATEATLAATGQTFDAAAVLTAIATMIAGVRRDADASPVSADGDVHPFVFNEYGRLKVASQPALYTPTVGTVTANGQTVPIACEQFSNLMVHCTGTFATVNCTFEGSLNSTNGTDGNWFTVQAIRSNANTIETTTGNLSAAPAYAWELSVNALKWFRIRATAYTSGTQTWTMIPGTYATEPIPGAQISGTQPVSGTVSATNTPVTPTQSFVNSAATTNATSVKATAGTVWSINVTNTNAAARYLKLYNKASAPTVGTDVPVLTVPIPALGAYKVDGGSNGIRFGTGIALAITTGAADSDTGAVAASEIKVATSYT